MTTPLISDATLAKIVRLAYLAPDLGSIIREDMLSCVVDGELATAIEMARGECHPVNYGGQLIAALEEANEEAARTNDEREPRVEGECQELNLVRGEWVTPGAVPGLARAMAESLGKVTLAAKHPASYEDPRPEVEAKRVALKNAIRAYTVDATGPDGEDVPNGPAEAASVALDKAILQAARILVHYDRTEVSDPLLDAAASARELEAVQIATLREAATAFFGEDFDR